MSVSAAMAHASRFLPLEGTLNTRDLGGLPVAGGRLTQPGRVLRSDGPVALTDADLDLLERLPLTTVVDLRGTVECEREPSRFLTRPSCRVHHVEVWSHIYAAGREIADRYDITEFYFAALDHAGAAFAEATRLVAHAPRRMSGVRRNRSSPARPSRIHPSAPHPGPGQHGLHGRRPAGSQATASSRKPAAIR